ncbi:hypothetical protein TCAL_17182 [Tigriopus californicus]|uniref:Uncharacterized protein n=1 Tax=Tigriopus californicus TaxID=6832 RepID=A0A553N8J1_TIGCA|nr:hypothetical protein TCAL_17182 [Tigriopus californicus]
MAAVKTEAKVTKAVKIFVDFHIQRRKQKSLNAERTQSMKSCLKCDRGIATLTPIAAIRLASPQRMENVFKLDARTRKVSTP